MFGLKKKKFFVKRTLFGLMKNLLRNWNGPKNDRSTVMFKYLINPIQFDHPIPYGAVKSYDICSQLLAMVARKR